MIGGNSLASGMRGEVPAGRLGSRRIRVRGSERTTSRMGQDGGGGLWDMGEVPMSGERIEGNEQRILYLHNFTSI